MQAGACRTDRIHFVAAPKAVLFCGTNVISVVLDRQRVVLPLWVDSDAAKPPRSTRLRPTHSRAASVERSRLLPLLAHRAALAADCRRPAHTPIATNDNMPLRAKNSPNICTKVSTHAQHRVMPADLTTFATDCNFRSISSPESPFSSFDESR